MSVCVKRWKSVSGSIPTRPLDDEADQNLAQGEKLSGLVMRCNTGQSQPDERHQRGKDCIQEENGGPPQQQQHKAGVAEGPAHHQLQAGNLSEAEELNVFFVPELTTTTSSCWRSMRCSAHCGGVDPRKSSGPDGVPGRVLMTCADQLCLHQDFQPVSIPVHCPIMLEVRCYHSSAQNKHHQHLESLPSSSTYTNCHEVL